MMGITLENGVIVLCCGRGRGGRFVASYTYLSVVDCGSFLRHQHFVLIYPLIGNNDRETYLVSSSLDRRCLCIQDLLIHNSFRLGRNLSAPSDFFQY